MLEGARRKDLDMTTVLIVIHLMVVLAIIGLVLLQRSEGGALGIGGGIMGSLRTMAQGEVTEYSQLYNGIRHMALARLQQARGHQPQGRRQRRWRVAERCSGGHSGFLGFQCWQCATAACSRTASRPPVPRFAPLKM